MQARSAIAAVVDRAPQSATLYDSGLRVRVEEVKVGTLLSVKTGDTVPIDGEVESGRGFVDESSLTGESIPVEKELGAPVWAGTINVSGMCYQSDDSLLERFTFCQFSGQKFAYKSSGYLCSIQSYVIYWSLCMSAYVYFFGNSS